MPRSSSAAPFVDVPVFADFCPMDAPIRWMSLSSRFGGCPHLCSVDVPILPILILLILVAILEFGPAVAECDDSVEDKVTRAMNYGISAEVA